LPHALSSVHSDRQTEFTKGKPLPGRLLQVTTSGVVMNSRERRGEQTLKQAAVGHRLAVHQLRHPDGRIA
jgi:hypothetical protein